MEKNKKILYETIQRKVNYMKQLIVLVAGIVLLCTCFIANAQEKCTEDFIFNADFSLVDNTGLPVDWEVRAKDKLHVEIENEIAKMWVDDGGNMGNEVIAIGQKFWDEANIISRFANDTIFLRAWVKSTVIDEPTDEELLQNYLEGDPNRDTTGTNFYHNLGSHGGFELVIQEAQGVPAYPWYIPLEWNVWYDHDGAAVENWTAVNGKVVLKQGAANRLRIWILLRSKSACTVWVDNIQMSSSPDFCDEPFESPDGTGATKSIPQNMRNQTISYHNNTIHFNQPTTYSLQVFSPNGQQHILQSGHAVKVNMQSLKLPAGAYIVNVTSERGYFLHKCILQEK